MSHLSFTARILLTLALTSAILHCNAYPTIEQRAVNTSAPSVTVLNGSYYGVHNAFFNQDFFLGIPFAQPPVGQLRLQVPQGLNTSWTTARNATQYSPICVGYNQTVGASEDCLTLNVVRPSGVGSEVKLPVAVWIYGGGFTSGSSSNPQYNLSFIVEESSKMGTPMIGVSLNYRLHCWGFLWSQEIKDAGTANLGFRDQRLALHWLQENIAAFGGDPSQVTIWGESAGGNSVGTQLIAYGGRDDKLFRAAISESGAPSTYYRYQTPSVWQPFYDAIVQAANCSKSSMGTLACLRTVPSDILHNIFDNSSVVPIHTLAGLEGPQFVQVIDGDFIQGSATTQLRNGRFVKVPYLIGGNADEGTSFAVRNINTTEQFIAQVQSWGVDNATANTFAALYPDIPDIGIPKTMKRTPPAGDGLQYKRVAAFQGDINIHAARRLASQMWATYNATAYSYLFDVINNGAGPNVGANHGSEVPYVFNNVAGAGYTNITNPFANEPLTYPQMAMMISRMWISFVTRLNPNYSGVSEIHWPKYTLDDARIIVFDTNVSRLGYDEPDLYRAAAIKYMSDHLDIAFGH